MISSALEKFPYYLLPPKQQQIFGLILSRVQVGAEIQMGPFSTLNYEKATDVKSSSFYR